MNDWQTWAALAAVLLAVLFLLSKVKRKKKAGSCGHDCGCGKK
ncbi:FeoB-associated Cys-rich membrane protein [Luteolibacter luteus]|uniref:FeoB-associated Cys-rich membrane protein n=1 Tax=Luteolibacter luteus TaxID=2728835 RepID=A0A858RMS3_9BACT|nr:FeoB-associated Cys-rich membrane protein [Luteolibacter luteus]QJE98152.1 FeoB-associated Cys-rich membrane protein [Luteolibacter luteus]